MRAIVSVLTIGCLLVMPISLIMASKKGTTDTDGPVTAFAHVYQARSKANARAKARAESSSDIGAYRIIARVESKVQSQYNHYRNGLSTQVVRVRRVANEDQAGASSWISGNDDTNSWYASASE